MSIIDTLRKFCDGTPLSPEEVDELGKRGFIKSRIGGDGYELTVTGRTALAEPSQLAYDQERNRPMSDFEMLKAFNARMVMNRQDLNYLEERKLITRGGNNWFLTTAGKLLLDSKELPPGDSASCPDDDSYLPPPVRAGQWQPMSAAQLERRIAQDNLNQQMRNALDKQEGGAHYKTLKIQPVEFIEANGIPFLEGCVIKRMCRHGSKAKAEDLRKAIHEIELLIELRYGEKA